MAKKVLLVSPYPYTPSSRGMDVMTLCFSEERWQTDHLTFPRAFYTPEMQSGKHPSIQTIIPRKVMFPYVDRIMFWFPRWLFNFFKWMNCLSIRKVRFESYDYIVLESGKPLFLLDSIPKDIKIIYRQSDSVKLVLGKNRWYKNLEDKVFNRAERIVVKKDIYRDFLKDDQKEKTIVIENGMTIPSGITDQNPFPVGTTNGVYVGIHSLDLETLKLVLKDNPGTDFHIIGPCLLKPDVKNLNRQYANFKYYSYLPKEQYMPLLKFADFAFFPFTKSEIMKWFGLTSKFLHFMYFKLPIISFPTGRIGEFDGLPVVFTETKQDFSAAVKRESESKRKIDYKVDFQFYSYESRKKEYKKFIKTLK